MPAHHSCKWSILVMAASSQWASMVPPTLSAKLGSSLLSLAWEDSSLIGDFAARLLPLRFRLLLLPVLGASMARTPRIRPLRCLVHLASVSLCLAFPTGRVGALTCRLLHVLLARDTSAAEVPAAASTAGVQTVEGCTVFPPDPVSWCWRPALNVQLISLQAGAMSAGRKRTPRN